MAGTTDRMTQGSLSLFLEKTKFSTQVIMVLKALGFCLGGSPSLPAEHPCGLGLPSLCILQNCIPTASLGTDMITPILQMGKLRLGEVGLPDPKVIQNLKEPSREPQIQFFKPVTDHVLPSFYLSPILILVLNPEEFSRVGLFPANTPLVSYF